MRVQKISNNHINEVDYTGINTDKTKISDKNNELQKKQRADFSPESLLKTLDNLENNIHMDNSHPLKKINNAPIESFEEAIIELNYFKLPFFKENASAAQANLKNEDVLYLFK